MDDERLIEVENRLSVQKAVAVHELKIGDAKTFPFAKLFTDLNLFSLINKCADDRINR